MSPMAKAIFKSMEENRDIEVLSRGVTVLFSEPINPKVETVLNNHNIAIEDTESMLLEENDIDDNTLVITLSNSVKDTVMNEYSNTCDTFTITEFVDEPGELLDPCGGTLAEYESFYGELSRLVKKTVYKIDEIEMESFQKIN